MPKRPRKKVKTGADGGATSSDLDNLDAMSTASQCGSISSEQSLDPFADIEGDEVDESTRQLALEDKLKEAIDGIAEKSLKGRVNNMKAVCKALRKEVLTEFLSDRYVTLTDVLERCLKKGKAEEQVWAAQGLSLLCIQLGTTEEGETTFANIQPLLTSVMMDPTASLLARAKCADALGLCGFISTNDIEIVAQIMSKLESIFTKSYLKGDKTAPNHSPQTYELHAAALLSWTLLLSISTPNAVRRYLDSHLPRLPELLESVDIELKIGAGEALALLYELAREQDEDFEGPAMEDLCERLKSLATDNNKHQTKKDRKQQRSSFRDVLSAVEEADSPSEEYKFGLECVYIDTWAKKRQYDSLCSHLETGMNSHLQYNPLLRDIFALGAPLPQGSKATKLGKNDRRLYNQAVFKARTQVRQKLRDKRTAQLSG